MRLIEPLETLQIRLAHVYWLGGSPCAGKSSIADLLAERYGMRIYRCDDAFYRHRDLITPAEQPVFYRLMQLSSEDLWMRPVVQQTAEEIEIYREEFGLILADLLAMDGSHPILAEGAALLPELIGPLIANPRRAIWVVPAPDFQLYHYSRREWTHEILKDCSDPQQAFSNWMDRDIAFARFAAADAQSRGLHVLVVDGQQSIAHNADTVDQWLSVGAA